MNVAQSFPRKFSKWLPWISGAILVACLFVFLGVRYSNTANPEPKEATGPAIKAPAAQKQIPFPNDAWQVAREFIMTAVARKHLNEALALTHPSLRSGVSLKEWRSGSLPVVYSPVTQILKTNWKNTNYAYPRDAQINVVIIPGKEKPWNAQVGLTKVGQGAKAHWLVSYFQPLAGPAVPTPK
ncbi:MAG TPA: hypothetical protein VH420_01470 [Gaiellaceae bacterium]